jgi:hypothetical protein
MFMSNFLEGDAEVRFKSAKGLHYDVPLRELSREDDLRKNTHLFGSGGS